MSALVKNNMTFIFKSQHHFKLSALEKSDKKFKIFQMQTCCVTYTLALHFCRKLVFKKCTVKNIKLTLTDDELVLMFLHKKRKKLRFCAYFFIFQEKTPGRVEAV